jgi:hypothetical protein
MKQNPSTTRDQHFGLRQLLMTSWFLQPLETGDLLKALYLMDVDQTAVEP